MLNKELTIVREETHELNALLKFDTLSVLVLVSADNMLCRFESTTDKDDVVVLNAVDKEEVSVLRVLASVESAVLTVESNAIIDTFVLIVLDNAKTALLRVDVSVESAVER